MFWFVVRSVSYGVVYVGIQLLWNAVLGWGDEQIAASLGIKSPTMPQVYKALVEFGPPIVVSAIGFYLYHLYWGRRSIAGADIGTSDRSYLSGKDSGLSIAIQQMVHRSAWGRWFAAGHLLSTGQIDDRYLVNIACTMVDRELQNGNLEIRGKPSHSATYEVIPRDTWDSIALGFESSPTMIWRIFLIPRYNVNKASVKKELEYDSLKVDSAAFLKLWPRNQWTADRKRWWILLKARWKGIDPALIKRVC
jgi:hypothetical protein